jgi:hypothetical protein
MDLEEVGWSGMEWIAVAQDRDRWLGARECANETSGSLKFREFLE